MAFATFGSGVLVGARTDIAGATPRQFATLQDVSVDFKGEIKQLYGQYQFPEAVARGKTSVSVKAKYGRVSGALFNDLFFGQASAVGATLAIFREAATVPAAPSAATSAATTSGGTTLTFTAVPTGVVVGAVVTDKTTAGAIAAGTMVTAKNTTTVTLSAPTTANVAIGDNIAFSPTYSTANQVSFATDLGVTYAATGVALTYTASAPIQGQYTVSGGVYIFSASDAAAALYVNYTYTSSTAGLTVSITNQLMGFSPTFRLIANTPFRGNSMTLTLNACISESLAFATKQDDFAIPELDIQAFADASGTIGSLSVSDAG
jgi:hypothetical protein